ncbi:MAG: acyl carrier protein, partial [Desulfobacteraceae bacterium]|nr:acyl carrier protein [Desulfobacteraceae bacterium]
MEMMTETIIESIIEGLREIFPDAVQMEISADTTLGQMPEWDSMAAVNLQTYLLQQFDVEVPLELLSDETTLIEIITFLKSP